MRKFLTMITSVGLVLLLSGCTQVDKTVNIKPLSNKQPFVYRNVKHHHDTWPFRLGKKKPNYKYIRLEKSDGNVVTIKSDNSNNNKFKFAQKKASAPWHYKEKVSGNFNSPTVYKFYVSKSNIKSLVEHGTWN